MDNTEAGVTRRKKATKAAVKVLLVDDSAENLRLFKTILESRGYEVATAANGEEALQKLRKSPADLIVSDILMPVMDGFLFLKQCKADAKLKGIRFVFLTATYMDKEDEELALKLGTDAFIRKPVEPEELLNKLEEVLASTPAPKKRGRKPKAEKAVQGNLYNLSLTQKLEKKMQDLEAEITGRRKVEDELRLSEDRYRLLFENMSQGVICMDEDARITSANRAVARISGLPVDRLIGMTMSDPRIKAIHEDGTDYPVDSLPMLAALRTGKPVHDEVLGIFNLADETYRWVSGSAIPMFRPGEDRPFQVYATFDDITDRHLAYKSLQESESRMAAILENTLDSICSVDTEFRLIAANSAARKLYEGLFGAPLIEGIDIRSVMPQERKDFWNGIGARVFKGEHVVLENRYELAIGPADLEFSLSPIISHASRITGISIFARDITGRKKVEQQLKESEERYRLVVENASEAIYVIQDGKVKFSRSGISPIAGYSREEILSKPFSEMVHPDDLKPMLENHRRRMLGEEVPSEYIYRVIHKNGDIRWVEAHMTTIEWEGHPATLMLQLDITERRQMEESVKNTGRLFKMLFLCNEAMVHATNESELFQNICNVMTEIGRYAIAWVGYAQDDENKLIKPIALSGADISRLEQAGISWADDEHGSGPAGRAIRTGKTVVVQDIALDPASQPWSDDVEKAGIASTIALALKYRDVVFGSLNIYAAQKNAFREEDISLLDELAEDLAYGITALREHRQREEAEAALKKSEELFRKAVQSTTDIVWDWDIGSGRVEWYGDIDAMLGYPHGEFPRTLEAWENALHPDDHNRVMAALNRHAETGEPYNVEYRIIRKDGSMRNWIDRGLVIRDEGGRIFRSVGACVDITEHRQSEARAKIRRDLALKLAGRIDMQTALKYCLDAAIEISGFDTGVIYVLDEKSGDLKAASHYGFSAFLIDRYSVLKADSKDARLIKKGQPFYVKGEEFTPPFDEQLKPEGFTFDAMIPVMYPDRVIASLAIFSHTQDYMPTVIRDSLEAIAADIGVIIDRLASRRALQASEERYRFITDHTADVIWVLDKGLRYTFVSPSVTRLRGFTMEEAMARDVTRQITPASLDELAKAITSGSIPPLDGTVGQQQWFTRELEMYRKDGSTVWMETSMTTITDAAGEFNGLLGISRDISARRQAEQSLRESEEKYRLVVENAREAIIVAQDGLIKFANRRTPEQFGYTPEELSSVSFIDLVHPDDRQMVIDRHLRRLKGELFEDVSPFRVFNKDGRVSWVEIQAVMIEWEGRPATLNFLTEITDRKLAEEALRQSEEKYRTILDEMGEAYYELDAKGNFTFFNDVVHRHLGYSREELLGLNYKVYTPPEERSRIVKLYSSVFSTGIPRRWVPQVNIRKDGSRIYLEDSIYPLRDEKGEIIGLRGLSRDVTGRVKAEKDIQQRAALLDSAYDSIIAYDMDGKIIYANQTACSIRGFSREEMLAMNMRRLVPVEELPGLEERHRQVLEQGELSSEAVHIRKDGSTFIVDTHLRLADLAGDKLVIAVQRDITLRKQMENQLVESEAKYRSLVDTSASGIAIAEESGNLVLVNDRLCDMFGYSRDEVLGKQFLDFVHPEEREKIAGDFFEAVASSKTLPMLEFRGVRKDGSTIWLFTTPNPLKIGDRLTGFSVVIQDITQLKQAETALKESEQRYRSLFQHNPTMVYALDRQARFTSINTAAVRISGYSEEEAVRMNFADVIAPEYLDTVKRNYTRSLNGEPQSYESVMIARDGRRIDIHITSTPIIIDGEVIGVYGIAEDITGRKQMEKLVRESEEKYRTVVENMHDVLYRTDNKGDITLVSPAVTRLLGVESVEQVIGKNLARDFYANPEDRVRALELMEAEGEVVDLEVNLRRPDGKLITVAANSHIYRDAGGQPAGVEGLIRDITERKKAEEELRTALERLGSSLESTIDAIAMMSELRDPYTAGHQRRVTQLALAIAAELGVSDDRMQPLRVAGLLHDVGKIYVPSEILSKPGRLTDLEMGLARAHATAGYDVVAAIKFPWPIADIVVQHHERMDGSGYPAGLKGDEIALEARILAVADVTEAMMSHRPYRPSLGMDKALAEITANRGKLYDEKAVDACIKLLTEKGFKFPD